MDVGRPSIKKKEINSAIHYKIYPKNKELLRRILNHSRWLHNQITSYLNSQKKLDLSIKFLRKKFINNEVYKDKENFWMLELPYDVRDNVLRDILHNYKTNFAKQKTQGGCFRMCFKKKKDIVCSMDVLSKYWKVKKGTYHNMYSMKFESSIKKPYKLPATSRLIYHKHIDQWFLSVPRNIIKSTDNQCDSVISLDPGVRTFLTGYSNADHAFEFGKDSIGVLARLLHHKNKIQSNMVKANCKKKRNLKKAFLRISKTIKNYVNDAHRKIIKFLASNYKTIYIPKLNFHNMKKTSKKVRSKLAVWNHCLFVDRLQSYCKNKVIICTEEFTSKTCSNCGYLKQDLGANKTFYCNSCGKVFDRDINAAKNILLKSLKF
jgi:transposase